MKTKMGKKCEHAFFIKFASKGIEHGKRGQYTIVQRQARQ